MLETTDVDNTDGELIYTITTTPGNGILYNNGVALGVSDTFSQSDIDAGLISYSHDGAESALDGFDFTVDDGAGTSISGTFHYTVTPVNDEQVLVTNTGATVVEGSTGNVITTAMLETTDVDNTDGELIYTITTTPGNGILYNNGVALGVSDTFSQSDIDAGLISYSHDGAESALDGFDFTVDDGAGTSTSGTFHYTVTPVNDEQVLATNTGATVVEGSTGNVITTAMLETTDVDNTDGELIYTITTTPGNGILYNNGVALGVSDTFSQSDIDAGLISYSHDGAESALDGFDFTVDDGAGTSTSGTFHWAISNVNDAPINTVPGAQVVNEDTSLNITGISVNDPDGNLATTTVNGIEWHIECQSCEWSEYQWWRQRQQHPDVEWYAVTDQCGTCQFILPG